MSNYSADHFRLLRLAKLRRLEIRAASDGSFVVSSHSRPGHFYHVRPGSPCPCDAKSDCTHMALVRDAVALESDHIRYSSAQSIDFYRLRKAQQDGEKLNRTDRIYQRDARELYRQKSAERAELAETVETF